MAACIGSYVRLYGYRNGVGGGTFSALTARNGVGGCLRRRNGDGVCCSARVPSARVAAAYRQSSRAALADGLVGGDTGADVRSHGYRNGVGCGTISVLTAGYGVTCSARRRYRYGLCCTIVAPTS